MHRILLTVAILCSLALTAIAQEKGKIHNTIGDTLPLEPTKDVRLILPGDAISVVGKLAPLAAVQAPQVSVTFTCNQTAPKCTEFLRLVTDATGWTVGNPQGLTRMQWLQRFVILDLQRVASGKKKEEDAKAAIDAAESAFKIDFPDPPE